jgi:hypothetical protein
MLLTTQTFFSKAATAKPMDHFFWLGVDAFLRQVEVML